MGIVLPARFDGRPTLTLYDRLSDPTHRASASDAVQNTTELVKWILLPKSKGQAREENILCSSLFLPKTMKVDAKEASHGHAQLL